MLLVEPFLRDDGSVDVRPVKVHAGGIVWHGDHVHVAGTARGFSSFRLDDIVPRRRPATGPGSACAATRVDVFGYRYVLPVRFTYDARAAQGLTRMRYSFASLDRSSTPHALVAGEYGRDGQTSRLVRYEIDPATSLLRADDDGRATPRSSWTTACPACRARRSWTAPGSSPPAAAGSGSAASGSAGPGRLVERRHQLPVGPEDITYWPAARPALVAERVPPRPLRLRHAPQKTPALIG